MEMDAKYVYQIFPLIMIYEQLTIKCLLKFSFFSLPLRHYLWVITK